MHTKTDYMNAVKKIDQKSRTKPQRRTGVSPQKKLSKPTVFKQLNRPQILETNTGSQGSEGYRQVYKSLPNS